jgi:hypothetical protein
MANDKLFSNAPGVSLVAAAVCSLGDLFTAFSFPDLGRQIHPL